MKSNFRSVKSFHFVREIIGDVFLQLDSFQCEQTGSRFWRDLKGHLGNLHRRTPNLKGVRCSSGTDDELSDLWGLAWIRLDLFQPACFWRQRPSSPPRNLWRDAQPKLRSRVTYDLHHLPSIFCPSQSTPYCFPNTPLKLSSVPLSCVVHSLLTSLLRVPSFYLTATFWSWSPQPKLTTSPHPFWIRPFHTDCPVLEFL